MDFSGPPRSADVKTKCFTRYLIRDINERLSLVFFTGFLAWDCHSEHPIDSGGNLGEDGLGCGGITDNDAHVWICVKRLSSWRRGISREGEDVYREGGGGREEVRYDRAALLSGGSNDKVLSGRHCLEIDLKTVYGGVWKG